MTDVEGSTRQWEAHPDAMHAVIARHDSLVAAAVESAGGSIVRSKGEGDSTFAVFPMADRACWAAFEAQRALTQEAWPNSIGLSVRMAIHTGGAELRDGDYYGPAPNRCARLRAVANGGQILVSGATQGIIESELPRELGLRFLGEHHLKDIPRPERIYQLTGPGLREDFPPLRTESRGTALPLAVTSFVGRVEELRNLKEAVARGRLVTVVGPPGAGKSRIAVEAASELADEFGGHARLVDLSAIADSNLVVIAIASALGVREDPARDLLASVTESLKAGRQLLVLDGCDHVIAESARVAGAMLNACADLHLLATSREPLGAAGEGRWPLQNLSTSDAVLLFAERARQVQPSFAVTDANRPAIEELVKKVDCIPLAIELAASRANVLNVRQMLSRLNDRFRLLAGGPRGTSERHQTLRAALSWSYDLLDQPERELFMRLSVFAGGFDIASAGAVSATAGQDEFEVIDEVGRLIDKSLVATEPGTGRLRLLESVRAYAREMLAQAGELDAFSDRHANHFLERAESTARSSMSELALEIDNFRAAQEWLDAHDAARALQLATALAWLWTGIGQSGEGQARLDAALARWPSRDRLRASASFEAGWFAWWRGEAEISAERFTEATEIARAIGDPLLEGRALAGHATLVLDVHHEGAKDKTWAIGALERAVQLLHQAGDRMGESGAIHGLGVFAVVEGRHADAADLLDRSIAIRREIDDRDGLIYSTFWKAIDALETADLETTARRGLESEGFAQEWTTHPMLGPWIEMVAELAARSDHLADAVTLSAAADSQMAASGIKRWNPVEGWRDWCSQAEAKLGADEFGAADRKGRAMSPAEAIALANELLTGAARRTV